MRISTAAGAALALLAVGTAAKMAAAQEASAQEASAQGAPAQDALAQGALALPPLRVEGEADSYRVDRAGTALKTDTPLLDTPAAVQVVPQALIEDQQALTLDEALRNVPGTVFIDGGEGVQIFSRGFTAQTLVDGIGRTEFTDGDLGRADLDTANVERIEVLKGPSSVLYGRGNPGGTVNIVTKAPIDSPLYSGGVTFGGHDLWRPTVDVSQPLTDDGSLATRLSAVYQTAGSFRDQVDSERWQVAPSFSWRPQAGTEAVLRLAVAEEQVTPDVGLPRVGDTVVAGLDRDDFFGDVDDFRDDDKISLLLTGEHALNDWLTLRLAGSYTDTVNRVGFTRGAALRADGRTLNRSFIDSRFAFEDWTAEAEALADVDIAGLRNEFLVGVDFGHRATDVLFASGPTNPIDIFAPNPDTGGLTGRPFFTFVSEGERTSWGAYAQDQLHLTERLILVGGLRFDHVDQDVTSGLIGSTAESPSQVENAFSPRAGLVFKVTPEISLYGQWARSFQPQNGVPVDVSGQTLDAETATLWEIGAKGEFLDGRLSAGLALFRINREDVVTADLANPGFQVAAGEQTSRGVELDLSGEPLPGLRLTAAYAFVEAEVESDGTAADGNGLSGIPEHSGNLWATYTLQEGPLEGLGFGGGLQYVGERPGDLANSFTVPSYLRTDATLFYERSGITARVNVRNLFDEEILLNPTRANFFAVGEPLTVLGNLSFAF